MPISTSRLITASVISCVAVGLLSGAVGAALGGARVANAPSAEADLLTLLAGRREQPLAAGPSASVLATSQSVVRFVAHQAKREGSVLASEVLGSGAVFTTDGWLLTHRDTVAGKTVDAVIGNVVYPVEKVIVDPFTQLAFAKVPGDRLPVMPFAKDASLAVGVTAYTADAGLGVVPAFVAAFGALPATEASSSERGELAYRFAVPSTIPVGQPVIAADGSAVGIVASTGGGMAVAVPFASVSRAAEGALSDAAPVRPYLGVRYRDLATSVVADAEKSGETGALLTAVAPQSPASRAGLRVGDVVRAVNGERPSIGRPLADLIARYAPGATLTVEYLRGDDADTASVVLTSL